MPVIRWFAHVIKIPRRHDSQWPQYDPSHPTPTCCPIFHRGTSDPMTEAARLHFDSDLSRPGLWNLSLDHLKRSTGATHLDDAHAGHTCSPRTHDSRGSLTRPSCRHRRRCQRLTSGWRRRRRESSDRSHRRRRPRTRTPPWPRCPRGVRGASTAPMQGSDCGIPRSGSSTQPRSA